MGTPEAIPSGFALHYEAERAMVLRRRLVWYCLIVIALLALSLVGVTRQLTGRAEVPEWGRTAVWIECVADLAMLLIHLAALVYVISRRPQRRRLVTVISLVMGLTATVSILAAPAYTAGGGALFRSTGGQSAQLWNSGLETLAAVFALHVLASLLIALSPKEGLRPLVPVLVLFAVVMLGFCEGPLWQRVALVGMSPLAGLPGLAWSWWRHRSFNERFSVRAMARKFQEVSREMSEARRVHEALFPAPVTDGPVRMRYRYEPASEIGGDFLFVRALVAASGGGGGDGGGGGLSVVVIDVTGHGVPAALAVNRLHDELRRIFGPEPPASPGRVIAGLNRFVHDALAPLGVYATAVCVECDAGGGARYANAGHPPCLVRGAEGAMARLAPTAPMLGVLEPAMFDADEQSMRLERGSCVVAYTDGAIEAPGGTGRAMGIEGVEEVVGRSERGSIAEAVARAASEHREGPAGDDVLVVEIEIV